MGRQVAVSQMALEVIAYYKFVISSTQQAKSGKIKS